MATADLTLALLERRMSTGSGSAHHKPPLATWREWTLLALCCIFIQQSNQLILCCLQRLSGRANQELSFQSRQLFLRAVLYDSERLALSLIQCANREHNESVCRNGNGRNTDRVD